MPTVSIAVQPPQAAQAGQVLYPPVIAKMTTRSSHERHYYFSMAVLLDYNGTVIEGGLAGNAVSTGVLAGSHVVFVFPDLSIVTPGEYNIRLDVYKVAYEDPSGATFSTQTATRDISIAVSNGADHHARPSSAERAYICTLRDAGVAVPSRPS
ncbi:hypothetical protein B0J13DRAFT_3728 [Dactylonectria estremocensis]|uniref:Velvet domain-containing protein n=1 Tax=Dactylonectria estremocensis TaxID=1079267 RepID=A0A9P9JD92_9HYPO|nr:hypothetical protein B0J13DRAFT_3728 [Dactylonectria estremocensis]